MEDSERETAFHWIMSAPGLSHIAEWIFLQLDPNSLIICTDVCSMWKWYIIDNRILRKNILKDDQFPLYDSSAPKHSHNRVLLKKFLGPKFEANQEIDPEEEFDLFKKYVNQMNPKEIEKKLVSAQLPKVKVFMIIFFYCTSFLKSLQTVHKLPDIQYLIAASWPRQSDPRYTADWRQIDFCHWYGVTYC